MKKRNQIKEMFFKKLADGEYARSLDEFVSKRDSREILEEKLHSDLDLHMEQIVSLAIYSSQFEEDI